MKSNANTIISLVAIVISLLTLAFNVGFARGRLVGQREGFLDGQNTAERLCKHYSKTWETP